MATADDLWDERLESRHRISKRKQETKSRLESALDSAVAAKSSGTAPNMGSLTKGRKLSDTAASGQKTETEKSNEQWYEKPFVKGAIDALSVGTYASANVADNFLDSINNMGDGNARGITDFLLAPTTGIAEGISGAFGNQENTKTYSDVIDKGMDTLNRGKKQGDEGWIDKNSDTAKWTKGIGGFVGDVALDPTTYLTLGAAPLIKGAVVGAREAGIAAKMAKAGDKSVDLANIPGKLEGAKEGALKEYKAFRENQVEESQFRKQKKEINKAVKKGDDLDPFKTTVRGYDFLPEYLLKGEAPKPVKVKDLRKAAQTEKLIQQETEGLLTTAEKKALRKDLDAKLAKEKAIQKDHADGKLDAVQAETALAANKAEVDSIREQYTSGIRATSVFEPTVEKTVRETVVDTPAPAGRAKEFDNVPDSEVKVPLDKILDAVPAGAKISDYTKITPVDRFVLGTEHLQTTRPKYNPAQIKRINEQIAKAPDVFSLDDAAIVKAGAKKEDIMELLISGPETFTKNTGRLQHIFEDMAAGKLDPAEVDKYREFAVNFFGKPFDSDQHMAETTLRYIKENSEGIQKSARSLAPTAVNGRLLNMSGAGKSPAVGLLKMLPEESDAANFRIPLEPQAAEEYLTEVVRSTEDAILNGEFAGETAMIADKVFKSHFLEHTAPKALRTNNDWGTDTMNLVDGGAIKEYWWTTHSNIDMFRKVNAEISTVLKTNPTIKGERYANLKDDMAMRIMANIDATLKGHGIFGYATNVMPDGGTAIRLSLFDVLDSMPKEMRVKYLWTAKNDMKNISPTQLIDVAETLMRSISKVGPNGEIDVTIIKPEVITALKGKYRDNTDVLRAIEENLDPQTQDFNKRIIQANLDGYKKGVEGAERARNQVYSKLFNDFVETGTVNRLAETTLRNTSLQSTKLGANIEVAADDMLERLTNAIENNSVGTLWETLGTKVPTIKHNPEIQPLLVEEVQKVKNQFATPKEQAVIDGQKSVVSSAEKLAAEIKRTKEVLMRSSNGKYSQNKELRERKLRAFHNSVASANRKIAERTADTRILPDNVKELVQKTQSLDPVINLARKQQAWDTVSRLYPFQRMFNRTFGMRTTYDTVTSGLHLGTHLETAFHKVLNDFSKRYTPEQLRQNLKTIQATEKGFDFSKHPDQGIREMAQLTDTVFSAGKNNFYVRNGITAQHMNDILGAMGSKIPENWRFEGDSPVEMAESWKSWTNIENPTRAFAVLHTAMVKASEDISMGARFSSNFGVHTPPVGDAKNWAKIEWKGGAKENAFYKLIDRDLYYPKEVINEIPALGNMLVESRMLKNETLNKWATQVFDPIISALKLTQTTMKPGHHVMSIQGDLLRNSLAGMGTSTREYKQAWRILRSRRGAIRELSGLDEYARVKQLSSTISIHGEGQTESLIINGKLVKYGHDSLYNMFEANDILLPAHSGGVIEDLITVPGEQFLDNAGESKLFQNSAKVANKVNDTASGLVNNRFIEINKFTAERDNVMRSALALHFMQSKSFKSLDEAVKYAAVQVKKWSPTAKDLTAAESKSARRIVFYYTWLRGITPRVAERAIQKPGWALAPAKAMYNLAVANGIDPQSLGDPFPEGELFPAYYRETVLGPQWQDKDGDYWGLNPTSPVLDVFNSLGSGASLGGFTNPDPAKNSAGLLGQTVMGMINPVFRAPVELGLGTNLSTGSPIIDSGQYTTDMIGPARFASKVTGHTVSPLNGVIPRRTEAKFNEGIGSEEDWWKNAALETANYLTGAQIKNYTSDSATKGAEFQEKANLKAEDVNTNRTEWWK